MGRDEYGVRWCTEAVEGERGDAPKLCRGVGGREGREERGEKVWWMRWVRGGVEGPEEAPRALRYGVRRIDGVGSSCAGVSASVPPPLGPADGGDAVRA